MVLVLACAAQFMVVLDVAIVNVALLSIQQDLGIGQNALQWIIVAGCPDHRPDIFPAEITRPCSASMRCISDAFQMPRCAAASRRFHRMSTESFQPVGGALLSGKPRLLNVITMHVIGNPGSWNLRSSP